MTFSTCTCFPFTCKQKLCHIIDTKAHLHKISSQVLRCVLTDPTAHKEGNLQIWGYKKMFQNVYNIAYSQAVTHPSTNATQCCLTSVIGRELVLSTWYGRRHWLKWKIDHVLKNIQVELSQTVWGGFLLYRNTLHKSHLVATLYNTSYTPKYKCGGSWFQSPKYWQSCQKCVVFIK